MPEEFVPPRDAPILPVVNRGQAPASPLARARSRAVGVCVAAGLVAGAAVAWNDALGVHLAPGRPGWALVQGAGAGGQVRGRAVLTLPGFDRRAPRTLMVDAGRTDGAPAILVLVADGGAAQPVHVSPGRAEIVTLPKA